MRTTLFVGLIGTLLLGAGCVKTVTDRNTPAWPLVNDRIEGRYERPMATVFQAAKDVITANGVLVTEGTLYVQGNPVKTVEGMVNQHKVWIRIEQVDQNISSVTVQARTKGGWKDSEMVHELEKQIALKLAQ